MSDEGKRYYRIPLRNNQPAVKGRETTLKGSDTYQTGELIYQLQEVLAFPQLGSTAFGIRVESRRAN